MKKANQRLQCVVCNKWLAQGEQRQANTVKYHEILAAAQKRQMITCIGQWDNNAAFNNYGGSFLCKCFTQQIFYWWNGGLARGGLLDVSQPLSFTCVRHIQLPNRELIHKWEVIAQPDSQPFPASVSHVRVLMKRSQGILSMVFRLVFVIANIIILILRKWW